MECFEKGKYVWLKPLSTNWNNLVTLEVKELQRRRNPTPIATYESLSIWGSQNEAFKQTFFFMKTRWFLKRNNEEKQSTPT